MALRDHTLDDKITAAARAEFLEKGYAGASLRKIAENAGVTVGAIQTRYRSKDELFQSLLQPFLDDIAATVQTVRADYYSGTAGDVLTQLKASMQHESAAILHLIFTHYEEAVLLIAAQFDSYRRIVAECRDRQTAERYMGSLMTYHYGGWTALFDAAKKEREGQK